MPQVAFEQLTLFELGPNLAQLREEAMKLRATNRAPRTREAYGSDWRDFERWCAAAGRSPRPAAEDTVVLYLTDLLKHSRITTAERRLAGIKAVHKDAGIVLPPWPQARAIITGARRHRAEQPEGRAPITVAQLRKIARRLSDQGTHRALRDHAIMVFGFASGLRRSNIAALTLADVHFERRGLIVHVRRSKTDQEGKGLRLGIRRGLRPDTCPVRTLRAWLRARGLAGGPLFNRITTGDQVLPREPISGDAVADVVKRCVQLIGLDPTDYGAHSLRAGCATAAGAKGVPEYAIMRRTGHRDANVMRNYIRDVDPFAGIDPLAGIL